MKNGYKKIGLMTIIMMIISHTVLAVTWEDWLSPESWKAWLANKTSASTSSTATENTSEDDENTEEFINLDSKKDESKIDFYATLGIKFFPEQYLTGNEITLKKHLNTLFAANKIRQAIAYFISLERKNHSIAISILETMNPDYRIKILLESPAVFIAKIFVDMQKDFSGKTLSHWGPYLLESEYFGKKIVDNAEIKGESISLRYIVFLVSYGINNENEFFKRAARLSEILSHIRGDDLATLLVYSHKEIVVKMGMKHESCFGAVKTKGYCEEETAIDLPVNFVSQLLNGMYMQGAISKQDLVNVLEKQFIINRDRFELILQDIDRTIIQEVVFNFSEEIMAFLPDDIIVEAMPSYEDMYTFMQISNVSSIKKDNLTIDNLEEKEDL